MFNMNVDQFQKHEVEDSYAPFPAGQYRAIVNTASVDIGKTGASSKHPNRDRTIVKIRFDVFGAKQDGGSRPLFTNYIVDHEVAGTPQDTDGNLLNMVKRNQNEVYEIVKNVIMTRYQGQSQQSPFAAGINPQTIPALANAEFNLDIGINKKSENYIKKFLTNDAAPQQPQMQQPQQPAPVGNVPMQATPAQATPNVAVQQSAASHSNGFAGGVPPFAQPQQA